MSTTVQAGAPVPARRVIKRRIFGALDGLGVLHRMRDSEWRRRRLLILCYHGISLDDEHEWSPTLYMSQDLFERRLRRLRDGGYNVLPLEEGIQRAYDGTLPPRSVALTFDDGTFDFKTRAFPLLKRYGFPATVYLTTYYSEHNTPVFGVYCAYLLWRARNRGSVVNAQPLTGADEHWSLDADEGRKHAHASLMAHARGQRLPSDALDDLARRLAAAVGVDHDDLTARRVLHVMTPAEVSELARAGVDIQLHTHRHRTPTDRGLFMREIDDNRQRIEAMRGSEARHFCYPSGNYRSEYTGWLTEAGVSSATTCDPGLVSPRASALLLPRFVDTSLVSDIEFDAWLTGAAELLRPRKARQSQPEVARV